MILSYYDLIDFKIYILKITMMYMKKKVSFFILAAFLFWIFTLPAYAESFKIQEVEIIETDIIEIQFTRELDASLTEMREFILEEESTAQEVEILLSEVVPTDMTKLTLMLGSFLSENTDYTITVLDIKDIDGNTIEAWIDSIFTFNTWVMSIADAWVLTEIEDLSPEDIPVEEIPVLEENISLDDSLNIDLRAADEIPSMNLSWMGGTTINSHKMDTSVTSLANQNDDLPETWPEIALLLLFALIFTATYTYIQKLRT